MGEGVQFDKTSAKRIGDTVRSVEGRPFPPGGLQRRRSGGGSRSTLWEIVSIETLTDSCTIKRVENTDWDLIDASEKADILYDIDDPPVAGDRGLLIRLGSGSLYFFRGRGIRRIYADKYSYIIRTSPNSTFGYPSLAHTDTTSTVSGVTIQRKALIKFERLTPLIAEADLRGGILSLGYMTVNRYDISFGGPGFDVQFNYQAILADFDPSTVTWNNHTSLTLGVQKSTRVLSQNVGPLDDPVHIRTGTSFEQTFGFANQQEIAPVMFTGSTYGLLMWLTISFSGASRTGQYRIWLDRINNPGNVDHQSFIEWR